MKCSRKDSYFGRSARKFLLANSSSLPRRITSNNKHFYVTINCNCKRDEIHKDELEFSGKAETSDLKLERIEGLPKSILVYEKEEINKISIPVPEDEQEEHATEVADIQDLPESQDILETKVDDKKEYKEALRDDLEEDHKEGIPFWKFILEMVAIFVVIMVLRVFVFGIYAVPSESMLNTLNPGDLIAGEKLTYKTSIPERGDIITFFNEEEGEYFVKRVIGLPGETVELLNNHVYINGEKIDESVYLKEGTSSSPITDSSIAYPYIIPNDEIWVMGDNRSNSKDSRWFGSVKLSNIDSKITMIYFPLDRIRLL